VFYWWSPCSSSFIGEVRVADLFSFLCCVLLVWSVQLIFLVFCVVCFIVGVRVAHLFSFRCCVLLVLSVLFIFLVFCVVCFICVKHNTEN
jgi:hypothetical protein